MLNLLSRTYLGPIISDADAVAAAVAAVVAADVAVTVTTVTATTDFSGKKKRICQKDLR